MLNSIDSSSSPYLGLTPIRLGALLGLLGVGLGAFGAHGLEGLLDSAAVGATERAKRIGWWETAAHYQLVHAVLLLALGALRQPTRAAPVLLTVGVAIFSGTLYAMSLGAPRILGAITPIGGVLLMLGWLALFLGAKAQP